MKQFVCIPILAALLVQSKPVTAQDIHFSQIAEIPLLLNPGATGAFNGWERVHVNHRNQWLGGSTQFMTSSIAADLNFFKSETGNNAYLGAGLFFNNDIGGDSRFGNQAAAISLSGVLPFGYTGHKLSVGLQGGYGSRSGDLNRVYFGNQWNGTAFDPTLSANENVSLKSFQFVDMSTGIFYQYDATESSFARNNSQRFEGGFSVFHVNKPRMEQNGLLIDRLHRKWVLHASYAQEIDGTDWAFDVSAVQFFQGSHRQTIVGGRAKRRFQNGSKITGFKQDAYVGFGAYFRSFDAVIPSFSVEWKGLKFGLSYDVTISPLRRTDAGGTLELSLSYTNRKHAVFKRRR